MNKKQGNETDKKKHATSSPPQNKTTGSTTTKVDLYVVVADDDVDDHKLILKAVMECNGNHLVTSVYNGLQLMNLLLRKGFYKVASERSPDLIILDLKMPVMDGYEALRQIRNNDQLKDIPVFVLSDSSPEEVSEKVRTLGADRFYSKPFSYDALRQLMNDICTEATLLLKKQQTRHIPE